MVRRKDELLDTVEVFLQGLNEPMHYKEIASLLLSTGAWDGGGAKEPDQVLYSRLRTDIRTRGEMSPFRFFPGGVFCASTVKGADAAAPPPEPTKQNRDPEKEARRRFKDETDLEYQERMAAKEERPRCGNCTHLNFENMYVVMQRRGICHNYTSSGRCGVSVTAEPCGHWERRTQGQKKHDRQEREVVLAALEKIQPDMQGKSARKAAKQNA